MSRLAKFLACMAPLLAGAGASAAVLGTLPPVTGSVPGSTEPTGITDTGIVIGSYKAANGTMYGFVGAVSGHFKPFSAGSGGTQARAINNSDWNTGNTGANSCSDDFSCPEYEQSKTGTITPVTMNGTQLHGIVQGINSTGVFVGDYHPAGSLYANQTSGFYGSQGKYTADLTLPFPTRKTDPRGINDSGEVVGFFVVPGQNAKGFVVNGGVVTVVTYPNANQTGTFLAGVNNYGWISGTWTDALGHSHGFVLSPDLSTFTDIVVPSATQVAALGINNYEEVAVSTDQGGDIFCLNGLTSSCSRLQFKATAAWVHPATSGSIRTVPCINACRFVGGTPAIFISPAGGREPTTQPRSRFTPQP